MYFPFKSVIVGSLLSLILVVAFSSQLFAVEAESGESREQKTTESSPSSETKPTVNRAEGPAVAEQERTADDDASLSKEDNPRGEVRREVVRAKLDEKKKVLCESRQDAVNGAMSNVTMRSKNTYERITKIYASSISFYQDKNLVVANYNALVEAVESAKSAALLANETLGSAPTLSCSSDGPKADVQEFRNKRLDKVAAFGTYRDAVKVLVKAIRDAAKAAETPAATDVSTEATN